jgi:hypothetical protein
MDSFVFDDYSKKVNQVSQFMMENKFLEAIRRLVEYGNREFLRSFQLRSEVKEGSNGNGNGNNNNNIITTDVATLVPPFETIGFLETKWLEVLKELVEYGNQNILGNFMLYLVMEGRRGREEYAKEVTSGILDIKKPEDKGKGKEQLEEQKAVNQEQHHHHNGSKNNQSWYTRPRDKNGRFMSSSTAATTTAAFSNTTTAVTITTTPTTITSKSQPWHNKLRDSRGRFVATPTAAPSAT